MARYTSAAPIFFAECDNYVDGGVKANNPTAFAITEIGEEVGMTEKDNMKLCEIIIKYGGSLFSSRLP